MFKFSIELHHKFKGSHDPTNAYHKRPNKWKISALAYCKLVTTVAMKN